MSKSLVSIRGRAYECRRCVATPKPMIGERRRVISHILKYHTPLDQCPYYCTVCLFKSTIRSDLQAHTKNYPLHQEKLEEMRKRGVDVSEATGLVEYGIPLEECTSGVLRMMTVEESEEVWSQRTRSSTVQAATPSTETTTPPHVADEISKNSYVQPFQPDNYSNTDFSETATLLSDLLMNESTIQPSTIPRLQMPNQTINVMSSEQFQETMSQLITTINTSTNCLTSAIHSQTNQFAFLRSTLGNLLIQLVKRSAGSRQEPVYCHDTDEETYFHQEMSERSQDEGEVGGIEEKIDNEEIKGREKEEKERQEKAERDRQEKAEMERQEKAEKERQEKAERERQEKAEMERQEKAEKERQGREGETGESREGETREGREGETREGRKGETGESRDGETREGETREGREGETGEGREGETGEGREEETRGFREGETRESKEGETGESREGETGDCREGERQEKEGTERREKDEKGREAKARKILEERRKEQEREDRELEEKRREFEKYEEKYRERRARRREEERKEIDSIDTTTLYSRSGDIGGDRGRPSIKRYRGEEERREGKKCNKSGKTRENEKENRIVTCKVFGKRNRSLSSKRSEKRAWKRDRSFQNYNF